MIKAFRSLQDVLQSPWAQPGALTARRTEGSDRIFRSTRLEDSIYADLRQGDEEMDAVEQSAEQKLKSFPALSRDIYQSFYSLNPRKVEEDILSTEAKKFNTHIIAHAMEQDDYPTLKNICEGRDLLSYEAASEFTSRTAEGLDDLLSELGGDKGMLHTLEKLEEARTQAEDTLKDLLERQKRIGQPDEQLERAIVAAANQLDSKQRQAEAVSKMIDTSLLRQSDQTDDIVADAVCAAKSKAEETQEIIGAWSDDPGNMSRCAVNTELLERVRQHPQLREVAQYLGRFREILAQSRKNGYAYGRGEKYSLELGNDISRALTSELAMLASPATVPLFLQKYQQKQIKQYRRREPVYKGMGDIICCIDESGSTSGEAAAWGKAVALTLLEIAAESQRKFAMIHFSGFDSFKTDLFLPGEYTVDDKLRAAEAFLDGGTDFETPLREALRLMHEAEFENADIVFITDGECELSQDFIDELHRQQAQHHFTVTGILLDTDCTYMDFSLKSFCQNIYRTSEMVGEEIVRQIVS